MLDKLPMSMRTAGEPPGSQVKRLLSAAQHTGMGALAGECRRYDSQQAVCSRRAGQRMSHHTSVSSSTRSLKLFRRSARLAISMNWSMMRSASGPRLANSSELRAACSSL